VRGGGIVREGLPGGWNPNLFSPFVSSPSFPSLTHSPLLVGSLNWGKPFFERDMSFVFLICFLDPAPPNKHKPWDLGLARSVKRDLFGQTDPPLFPPPQMLCPLCPMSKKTRGPLGGTALGGSGILAFLFNLFFPFPFPSFFFFLFWVYPFFLWASQREGRMGGLSPRGGAKAAPPLKGSPLLGFFFLWIFFFLSLGFKNPVCFCTPGFIFFPPPPLF